MTGPSTPARSPQTAVISTIGTPIGLFTVIADRERSGPATVPTVLAAGWTADPDLLLPLISAALRPSALRPVARIDGVTEAVIAYHDGDVTQIDAIPVRQSAGPYLDHAWDVLRRVPAGAPVSYTAFAVRTGRPAAIRAAASACARNAVALFVPCHRILRSDGTLGGFRWGLPAKAWLLEHEREPAQEFQPALIASS